MALSLWHARTGAGERQRVVLGPTGKLLAEVKAGVRDAAARVLLLRLPRKRTAL